MADEVEIDESELIMMESAISREIGGLDAGMLAGQRELDQLMKNAESVTMLLAHVREAVRNCKSNSRPVVSLHEFKRLREEEQSFEEDLSSVRFAQKDVREKLAKLTQKISDLQAQLRQIKHSLDTYQPKRTVLEFKTRDQLRNPA